MSFTPIKIDRGDIGVRIDQVLVRHLAHIPGVTRNRLQRLVANGSVLVNGRPVGRPSSRIAAGDAVAVELPERRPRAAPAAEDIPVTVLYEDESLLIVDKPPGQVAHPAFRHTTGTLLNALLAHAKGQWTPALLSRLDKGTSGLVLVAKNHAAQTALQRLGNLNGIEKDYVAIVAGRPPVKGIIDLALDRDPWDRRRVTVRDRGGVPSVTRFERLRSVTIAPDRHVSLVRCRLVTGRMHQIRVHLAAKGWPIVGDPVYGSTRVTPGSSLETLTLHRQALHAWHLAFTHPLTGGRIDVTSPIPDDMLQLMETTGLGRHSARARSITTVPSAE